MIPYLLYMMFLGPRLGRLRLALIAFALLAELFVMESHGRDALGGRDVRQAFEDLGLGHVPLGQCLVDLVLDRLDLSLIHI